MTRIEDADGACESRSVSRVHPLPARWLLLAVLGAIASGAATAEPARAADDYPCLAPQDQPWAAQVQLCPLTSPLSNGWVPVYRDPVANPPGSAPPQPAGWLHGTANQHFVCERPHTGAVYYHPRGWRNYWWAYTLSDDGVWGWVPEVFFRGGLDDEPDGGLGGGLRLCDPSGPAQQPP